MTYIYLQEQHIIINSIYDDPTQKKYMHVQVVRVIAWA